MRSLVFTHQIRLVGELVKFRACDARDALGLFRAMLLRPFAPAVVHCVATLLESCGRFLFVSKSSRARAKAFLVRQSRVLALSLSLSRGLLRSSRS